MLPVIAVAVALLLAVVGYMRAKGDDGIDRSTGRRVGPVIAGNPKDGIPFFVMAAIVAAGAAWLFLGRGFG